MHSDNWGAGRVSVLCPPHDATADRDALHLMLSLVPNHNIRESPIRWPVARPAIGFRRKVKRPPTPRPARQICRSARLRSSSRCSRRHSAPADCESTEALRFELLVAGVRVDEVRYVACLQELEAVADGPKCAPGRDVPDESGAVWLARLRVARDRESDTSVFGRFRGGRWPDSEREQRCSSDADDEKSFHGCPLPVSPRASTTVAYATNPVKCDELGIFCRHGL